MQDKENIHTFPRIEIYIKILLANIPSGNKALNNFSFMQITEGPEYG